MNLRLVFLNSSNNLRAGWRIVIFLVLQISLSEAIVGLLRLVVPISGAISLAVGYVILLGTTFIVLRIVDHRPFHAVGLPINRRLGIEWAQGFLISLLMISAVFVVEYFLGYVHLIWRGQSLDMIAISFLTMFFTFLWFGFGEELLFRGYCFQALIEGTNKYIAILTLSGFFGLAHIGNPNVTFFGVINTILAGVWFSVAYLKTRTLWFPTSLHATWNFFQGYLYSFPVSGLELEHRSLFSLQQGGPDWVTGGAYGPEAGILTTLVLLIATLIIIKSSSVRTGEGFWRLEPQVQSPGDSIESQR